MRAALTCAAFVLLSVSACNDGFSKGWLVDRTRVLGARVEATTDATRASIAPGETAKVTWILAGPGAVTARAWTAVACVPPPGTNAAPACADALIASMSGVADSDRVAMELAMPDAAALGGATEVLVLAAFCEGAATLDAPTFTATCASGEPLLASVRVRLASAGANANPSPPSPVRLGDDVLTRDAIAGAACDASLVRVAAGGPARDVVFTLRAEDREAGESLVASHFVTAGTLDRQYSTLDANEAAPKEIHVAWTPPARSDVGDGVVVRFVVAVRDGRGGLGFTTLAACASP